MSLNIELVGKEARGRRSSAWAPGMRPGRIFGAASGAGRPISLSVYLFRRRTGTETPPESRRRSETKTSFAKGKSRGETRGRSETPANLAFESPYSFLRLQPEFDQAAAREMAV
jgi:hypothetical protein